MKIYTKKGDRGTTYLFRGGKVSKDSLRVEAFGDVDELNSVLGWVRTTGIEADVDDVLDRIQNDLFRIGADLATPAEKVSEGDYVLRLETKAHVFLEEAIDSFDAKLPPLKDFILPGGSGPAAALHVARTVCRRAERSTVALKNREEVNPQALIYLNRLSDLLFVFARYENKTAGTDETTWKNG